MARVALENVWKVYGDVEAVKGLSLDVRDKEFVVLIGPSGAGKTSTLKVIAGVEPITAGQVYIDDRPVNRVPPSRRGVAMAFESYALYPHMSVFDNIAFPLRAPGQKLTGAQVEEAVNRVAGMLGIQQLLDRQTSELSGGQRQRVALGRAMVRRPGVFLMDEPLSHLDAKLRHRMRAEMKTLAGQISVTTIYVTHDYLEALALADRIAVIDRGELQQVGTPDEIYYRPANTFVAALIGQPPINLLDGTLVPRDGSLGFRASEAGFEIALPSELGRAAERRNARQVKLGIRPGDIAMHRRVPGPGAVQGQVYVSERLFTKQHVSVRVGSSLLTVVGAPEATFAEDEPVALEFEPGRLHLFDAETNLRVA